MMNIAPLNLDGTPIWQYIRTYCSLRARSPEVAYAWINNGSVPEQLKKQVYETGESLANANITP